jgi:hypothetical protein
MCPHCDCEKVTCRDLTGTFEGLMHCECDECFEEWVE